MQTFDEAPTKQDSDLPGKPSAQASFPAGMPATGLENLTTLLGGIWLVIGLFIDGYAHSEIIDTETEDFFTPWHGIFYTGFLFVTAAIGWIIVRRSDGGPARSWVPPGYGWSVVGVAVFAVGGIGDGIWHTILGVETGIDALLSPTHLLLFVGMILILLTPFRSFWSNPAKGSSWSEAGGAVASIAFTSALTAFFFTYAFGLSENWPQALTFDPIAETNEEFVELGIASAYVATLILVVPLLAILRRTDLPVGGATLIFTVPVVLENFAFGGELVAIPSAFAAGVVFELALRTLRSSLGRRRAVIAATGISITGMWSIWMALSHLSRGVAWMPELWSGQIVMCGVVATALAALAFAPPVPGTADAIDVREKASALR